MFHHVKCALQQKSTNHASKYGEEKFPDLRCYRFSKTVFPDLKGNGRVIYNEGSNSADLKNAEELEFQYCRFFATPELSYTFTNITHLRFQSCDMKNFRLESLKMFVKLFYLSLDINNLTRVPAEFACFPNLMYLSMTYNKISVIEQGFLDKLESSNLSYIDFQNNGHIHICCNTMRGDKLKEFKSRLIDQIAPKAEPPNLSLCSLKTIQALWESKTFADFTIKVEDKEFKVHKSILAIKSIIFRRMLNTEMKEKVENEMTITEFAANVVEEFLHFIYAVSLPDTDVNIMDLFAISAKYEVEDLREYCEKRIRLNLNEENAPDVCKLAHLYERSEMQKEAFAILKKSLEKCYSGIVVDENLENDPEKLSAIIEARISLRKILKRKAEDSI